MTGINIPGHCYCTKPHRGPLGLFFRYKCDLHTTDMEKKVREIFPHGMRDGIDLKIEFRIGFEDFGSYENWGQGWVVEGAGCFATASYLDDAFNEWYRKAKHWKDRYEQG